MDAPPRRSPADERAIAEGKRVLAVLAAVLAVFLTTACFALMFALARLGDGLFRFHRYPHAPTLLDPFVPTALGALVVASALLAAALLFAERWARLLFGAWLGALAVVLAATSLRGFEMTAGTLLLVLFLVATVIGVGWVSFTSAHPGERTFDAARGRR